MQQTMPPWSNSSQNSLTMLKTSSRGIFSCSRFDHIDLIGWPSVTQRGRAFPHCKSVQLFSTTVLTISCREVHLSDLIKAHEGNSDKNEDYPTKIPWGKYNLMGRFIMNTIQCQTQCRNSQNYEFPDRPHIVDLIFKQETMSTEVC